MSKFSEKYVKILNEIDEHLSNEEEKKYVLKKVSELSCFYMDIIDRITGLNSKRMDDLEKYQGTNKFEEWLNNYIYFSK